MPRYDLLDVERYNRLTVQTQRGCPGAASSAPLRSRLTPNTRSSRSPRCWPRSTDPTALAAAVHRVRRRQHVRQPAPFQGAHRALAASGSMVHRDRHLGRRRPRAADLDARGRLRRGAHRPREPDHAGHLRRRAAPRLEAGPLRRLPAAIERIQSHGIAVNGCFVLGLDGDGPEVFEAVEPFVRESGQFDVQITVLTAFPGTPLYARLQAEGRLLIEGPGSSCTLFDVNFQPHADVAKTLQHEALELGRRLYTDDRARRPPPTFPRPATPLPATSERDEVQRMNVNAGARSRRAGAPSSWSRPSTTSCSAPPS